MGQGWFARPPKGLFEDVNALNDDRQAWATKQLQKTHDYSQGYAVGHVYNTTKQDLLGKVTSQVDTAAKDATLAVQLADTRFRAWASDRQSSRRGRARLAFQENMTVFAGFLENFSGIVEVVRAADEQYGGLAYGTLSIFVGVFVRKTQREEALLEGFAELSSTFPRLETLQRLGQTHDLRTVDESDALIQLERLLAETFALVIVFAREATQYYASRTRRFKDTFIPERIKSGTLVQIRGHLEKVRDQCDALMLTKISSLQTTVNEMSTLLGHVNNGVVDINKEVVHINQAVVQNGRRMQQSNAADSQTHESQLRRLLGVTSRSANSGSKALESLEFLICDSFSRVRSKIEHPRPASIDLLKADADFSKWWEMQRSCFLVAGGENWREESSIGPLNWLSLGAILVIKELQRQHKNVAYYLAELAFMASKPYKRSLRDVMANLILQIALLREDALRTELDVLEDIVGGKAWKEDGTEEFWAATNTLLATVLDAFAPDFQLWIVIDRLDRCSWSDGYDEHDQSDFQFALNEFLLVLSEATCCVKVLIVVDALCAEKYARNGPLAGPQLEKCLILKRRWCQEPDAGRW